jgi:hypothetical protein
MFSRSIIDEDNGRELIIIFIILLKKDLWTWGHSTKKDQGGGMATNKTDFSHPRKPLGTSIFHGFRNR